MEEITHHQHDSADSIDWIMLKNYINMNRPVLWLDNGGWPAHQSDMLNDPNDIFLVPTDSIQ
jgi:hypothetical protein